MTATTPATSARVHDTLSSREKLLLFCMYCQEKKPAFRSHEMVCNPRTGEPVSFWPGRFLNNLIPKLTAKNCDSLIPYEFEMLNELTWFPKWYAELCESRLVGRDGGPPSLNEEVRLVALYCQGTLPARGVTMSVTRNNGTQHTLQPFVVMERAALNWHVESEASYNERVAAWKADGSRLTKPRRRVPTKHSKIGPDAIQDAEACPWFESWFKQGKARRNIAELRKDVTPAMKVDLIVERFNTDRFGQPKPKPTSSDEILIKLDNGRGDFVFRPTTFLDDIVENWIEDTRSKGVKLDAEQRRNLETLPWFKTWIYGLLKLRQARKRAREEEEEASSSSATTSNGEPRQQQQLSKPQTPLRETE